MLCSVTDGPAKEGVVGTQKVRLAAWQEQVIAKANFVECERARLWPSGREDDDPILAATNMRLEAACRAAGVHRDGEHPDGSSTTARRARRANRWTGAPVKGAFVHLHAAVVGLVDLYTEEDIKARSPGVLARMQACLAPTDRRRQEAEAQFGTEANNASTGTTSPPRRGGQNMVLQKMRGYLSRGDDGNRAAAELSPRRAAFREAMKISYEAADEQHARVRSLRNVLLIAAALLTALVVLVCVVGWRVPEAIPLCFKTPACPSTDGSTPQPGDVPIVALMGMLGGAMSATFAIQKLRTTPTPIPIDLQVSLAFLKLPAGALTAIGGLVLIHGEFIPGLTDLDTQGQILAYAIVLGVAQQLVTRFVDQKAEDVLAAVPSKGRRPESAEGLDAEIRATGQETPAVTSTA
jgi:hypothetical protein